jgi:hypothetical protein
MILVKADKNSKPAYFPDEKLLTDMGVQRGSW